jgi:hypothetical protein
MTRAALNPAETEWKMARDEVRWTSQILETLSGPRAGAVAAERASLLGTVIREHGHGHAAFAALERAFSDLDAPPVLAYRLAKDLLAYATTTRLLYSRTDAVSEENRLRELAAIEATASRAQRYLPKSRE